MVDSPDDEELRGLRLRVEELTRELARERGRADRQRFLGQLLESLRDSVIATDLDGRVLTWSAGAEALYGHPAREAVGCSAAELLFPSGSEDEASSQHRAALERGVFEGRARQRDRDGNLFWAASSVTLVEDRAGQPAALVRIDRDVTDEHIEIQSLRESEARLRTLIENSLDIIFEVSERGRIRYVSPRCEALLGFAPRELIDRGFGELVHPEDRDPHEGHLTQVLHTGARIRSAVRLKDRRGRWRWFECASQSHTPPEGQPRAVIVARDITARRDAEEAVQERERRLRLMANALPVWIAYIDRERRFRFNNETYERWFGAPADATLGRPIWEVIGHTQYELARPSIDAALEGQTASYELRMRHADGEMRDAQVDLIPHREPNGEIQGFYGLVQDISVRKQAAERQQRMVRELDHRVKNALATVVALAEETLLTAASEDDFRQAFISRIRTMARSHEALARSDWRGAGLVELTSTVLAAFVDPDAHQLEVEGEDLMLRERGVLPLALSLHELATNSLKHGALGFVGGRIALRWSFPDSERLRLLWEERHPGHAPARRDEGTGTGIQLVEDLVRHELGGEVAREFHDGGVTWRLDLPVSLVDKERAAGANEEPAPRDGGPTPLVATPEDLELRVLIVEDDRMQTRHLERMLARVGCTVAAVAGRVPEALARIDDTSFDCVILDIDLAGEPSAAVAATLIAGRHPFVLLTGYTDANLLALEHPGAPLLTKPVEPDALADALRQAVYRQ